MCYKDGPELPLLNFSTTCITSGRYVIFFNERQDGVAYPAGYEVTANVLMELCEVVVNGKYILYIFLKVVLLFPLFYGSFQIESKGKTAGFTIYTFELVMRAIAKVLSIYVASPATSPVNSATLIYVTTIASR